MFDWLPAPPHVAMACLGSFASSALICVASRVCMPASSSRYSRLSERGRGEWDSHVVSQVHAAVASLCGFACVVEAWQIGAWDTPEVAALSSSTLRSVSLMITCGYLLFDSVLLAVYFDLRREALTVLHHVGIITAFAVGIASGIGTVYMSLFLTNEVSTLFLNANFWMATSDTAKSSCIYAFNGVCLAVSFFVFRIALNTAAVAHMIGFTWMNLLDLFGSLPRHLQSSAVLLSALALVHVVINILWFGKILAAVRRKLARRGDEVKKNL